MIGSLVVGLVAIVFLMFGYLIWKKEKISLLHDYHYQNVTPENKKVFCALSGQGLVLIGLGLLITAVMLAITESLWSFLAFVIGFALGLARLISAGQKYNAT